MNKTLAVVYIQGEPPAVNNLIELGIDSCSSNGGAAGGFGGGASMGSATNQQQPTNMTASGAPTDPLHDMSAAERKQLEANGRRPNEYDNRRPPSSPPGGGGGGGDMAAWGGVPPAGLYPQEITQSQTEVSLFPTINPPTVMKLKLTLTLSACFG